MHFLEHDCCQVLNEFLCNKVVHKELVLIEQFLEHPQMARLVVVDDIIEDEHNPLRHMHLKEPILPYQLSDDLVDGVVEFHEFFPFVVFVREDLLHDVHLHVEEQFE